MPILTEEPPCYPGDLFDSPEINTSEQQQLWVFHTKPKQEKALGRELTKWQIPHYLPLRTKRNRIRGKTVPSYLPIFSGYIFLLADPEQRLKAFSTHRAVRSIPVGDQQRLWTDLHQLKRLISSRVPIQPEETIQPGMVVEICSGPLTGLKGKLVGTDEKRRFIVEVDFIQKGGAVTLEKDTEVRKSDWNY